VKLRWTPASVRDLTRLRAFVGKDSQTAARVADRLRVAAAMLRQQPLIGPAATPVDFRTQIVGFGAGSYVLRYRVDPDAIVIMRIWHSREERR